MPTRFQWYWSRLKFTIRYRGIGFTILWFVFSLLGITRTGWFTSYRERQFDRRYRVETAERVPLTGLDVHSNNLELSVPYEPCAPEVVMGILSELPIRHDQYTFVDLGSGKGVALLMASMLPFKQIIGVEWSPWIAAVARQNVHNFRHAAQRCQNIEVINGDATVYSFPEEPLVIFLYNPFHEKLTRKVFDNIRDSIEQCPRHVVVVYYNPRWKNIVDGLGCLRLVDVREHNYPVAIYESESQSSAVAVHDGYAIGRA
jgi:hypothetical protein